MNAATTGATGAAAAQQAAQKRYGFRVRSNTEQGTYGEIDGNNR